MATGRIQAVNCANKPMPDPQYGNQGGGMTPKGGKSKGKKGKSKGKKGY